MERISTNAILDAKIFDTPGAARTRIDELRLSDIFTTVKVIKATESEDDFRAYVFLVDKDGQWAFLC